MKGEGNLIRTSERPAISGPPSSGEGSGAGGGAQSEAVEFRSWNCGFIARAAILTGKVGLSVELGTGAPLEVLKNELHPRSTSQCVGIIGLPFIDIRALVPFLLSSGTPFGGLFRFEKEVTATLFARGVFCGIKP